MKKLICAMLMLYSVNVYAADLPGYWADKAKGDRNKGSDTSATGEWLADPDTGCRVWNPAPSPSESIKWSGACSNNTATGRGTLQWYHNGKPRGRMEGEFQDGKLNGKGFHTNSHGDRFEGDFVDSNMRGRFVLIGKENNVRQAPEGIDNKHINKGSDTLATGEWLADPDTGCRVWNPAPSPGESIKWPGACSNNTATGKGTVQWYLNGKPSLRQEGEFRDGKLNGKGVVTATNGLDWYKGDFVDSKPTGKGVRQWPNGDRYEGDFVDGKQTGKGVYIWPNGDRYEGDFVNGKQAGKGIYVSHKGTRYEGDFVDNQITGKSILYFKNVDKLAGSFVNAELSGEGSFTSVNGVTQKVIRSSDGNNFVAVSTSGVAANDHIQDRSPSVQIPNNKNNQLPADENGNLGSDGKVDGNISNRKFGAIALWYGKGRTSSSSPYASHSYIVAWKNASTKESAENSALSDCAKDGKQCRLIASFSNSCTALAKIEKMSGTTTWWWNTNSNSELAKKGAIASCKGGCEIYKVFCAGIEATSSSYKRTSSSEIIDCAANLDADCMKAKLADGASLETKASSGITPIFSAINSVRSDGMDTKEGMAMIHLLISEGADLDYKVNPFPMAIDRVLTPKDFLIGSFHKGIYDLPAPDAPKTKALFEDAQLLAVNKKSRVSTRRAADIGISKTEYLERLGKVDQLRLTGTFESYSEAFLLSRSKDDFMAAQKLVKTSAQKKRMEYLAVTATEDKNKIFDISVKLNGTNSKVNDQGYDKTFVFVLNVAGKTADMAFVADTEIRQNQNAPISLVHPYRVTVNYTLIIDTMETQGLGKSSNEGFIGGLLRTVSQSTKEERKTITKSVDYEISPKRPTKKQQVDFGRVEISSDKRGFGGVIQMQKTLKGEPILTAEVIKVEQL